MRGPKARAFKGTRNPTTKKREMSNWDRTELAHRGSTVDALRTGNLAEHRHSAYLKAHDYTKTAVSTAASEYALCLITIASTPQSVPPEQARWAYAHVDVVEEEMTQTAAKFRENLSKRACETQLCEICDTVYLRSNGNCSRCHPAP